MGSGVEVAERTVGMRRRAAVIAGLKMRGRLFFASLALVAGAWVGALGVGSASGAVEPPTQPVYFADWFSTAQPFQDPAGSAFATFPLPETVFGVAPSPDAATLYYSSAAAVYVVDRATRTVTSTIPLPAGSAPWLSGSPLAISPDGGMLYTAGQGGVIAAVDLAAGTASVLTSPGGWVRGVGVSPDGTRLIWTDWSGNRVGTFDLTTGTQGPVVTNVLNANAVAFAPNGSTVTVVATATGTPAHAAIRVYDPVTLATVQEFTNAELGAGASAVYSAAYSLDGQSVYAAVYGSSAHLLADIDITNRQVHTAPLGGGTPGIIGYEVKVNVTANGDRAYVSEPSVVSGSGDPSRLYTYDTAAGTVTGPDFLPANTRASAMTVLPDQAPRAAFTPTVQPAGTATTFDASATTVAFGTVAQYDWDFGDGTTATTTTPITTHTYTSAGDYAVTLTTTSSSGSTTTTRIYNGQWLLRNGSPAATTTASITVPAPPTLQLGNPGNQIDTVGSSVTLRMVAESGGAPVDYTATGLPGQLTLDPTTGVITGAALTVGTTRVQITACLRDTPTVCDTVDFTWEILPAPTPPMSPPSHNELAASGIAGPLPWAAGLAALLSGAALILLSRQPRPLRR